MLQRFGLAAGLAGVMAGFTAGIVPGATAQGLREVRPRGMLGAAVVVARPVGEFQNFVDWGGGVDLFGVLGLGGSDRVGLRLDGSVLIYGHESVERPFSSTIQRVNLDVNTTNSILSLGLGPQVTLAPAGPLRPYVYGTVGFSYFSTTTSLQGTGGGEPFASNTDLDDLTFAASGGAGVQLRVNSGRKPVSLDFSVNTTVNGEAEYLREGSIGERADGTPFFVPIRSEANLVTFRMGVTVGIL